MTESRNGNAPQGGHEYEMWDAAYVLDALSDTDRREFEMHMDCCSSCRQAVAEFEALAPMPSTRGREARQGAGRIPAELNGWYLRNGPNPRTGQGHWCVGDGMVHGIRLENGRAAWYRNRWVRTESFEHPVPLYNDDGSRNLHSSIANTHVVRHAGKTLALMEFSLPYEISNDLKTLGVYDFGGKLTDSMTAHPKICPTTGEMHFFGCGKI